MGYGRIDKRTGIFKIGDMELIAQRYQREAGDFLRLILRALRWELLKKEILAGTEGDQRYRSDQRGTFPAPYRCTLEKQETILSFICKMTARSSVSVLGRSRRICSKVVPSETQNFKSRDVPHNVPT
jgi:hypothetical protein